MMTMMTKGSPTLAPDPDSMFIEKVNSLLATAWRLILLRGPGPSVIMFRYVQIREMMQSDPSDAQSSDIRFGPFRHSRIRHSSLNNFSPAELTSTKLRRVVNPCVFNKF